MYGSADGVAALLPGAHIFVESAPDAANVVEWLQQGSAIIDRALSAGGYQTPISESALAWQEVTALSNLYAAAQSLRARGLDTVQGTEEARSEVWLRDFRDRLKEMAASDLTGVGVNLRLVESPRQRRIRSVQMRRIDGYSGAHAGLTTPHETVSD